MKPQETELRLEQLAPNYFKKTLFLLTHKSSLKVHSIARYPCLLTSDWGPLVAATLPGHQAGGAAPLQVLAEPLGLLHILDLLSQEASSGEAEYGGIIEVLVCLEIRWLTLPCIV